MTDAAYNNLVQHIKFMIEDRETFEDIDDVFQCLESGLANAEFVREESAMESPTVVDPEDLPQVLCDIAWNNGWVLTYKLEKAK